MSAVWVVHADEDYCFGKVFGVHQTREGALAQALRYMGHGLGIEWPRTIDEPDRVVWSAKGSAQIVVERWEVE